MSTPNLSAPPRPWAADVVGHLVDQAARAWPDQPALAWADRRCTFAELRQAAGRAASRLERRGVRRGDRVVVVLDDLIDAVAIQYGAALIGAVTVPVGTDTPGYAADHLLGDAEPSCVCSTGRAGPLVVQATARAVPVLTLRPFEPDGTADRSEGPRAVISSDPATILYTSGSTGRPKGVVSTHANILFAARAIAARLGLRPDDTIGCVLPLAFDYGAYQVHLALLSGATVALGGAVDAGPGLLRFLSRHEVTVLPAVPGITQNLLRLAQRRTEPLPPLRLVTNTGSAMSPDLVRRTRETFPGVDICLMFGLTECKRVSILAARELDERPTSVGRPLDDTEVLVVGPDGRQVLPAYEVGELVVRGPHVTRGYWRDPERTAARFRPFGPAGETVLFSGDRGWLDAEGYLYFEGRDDDVYKSRGFRVSATEVAVAAEDIPQVEEAYCLPPHQDQGPCLAVVTSLTAERIRRALHDRLEPFKIPDRIEVLSRLPLKPNGKTDALALRAQLAIGAPVPVPSRAARANHE